MRGEWKLSPGSGFGCKALPFAGKLDLKQKKLPTLCNLHGSRITK